MPVWVGRKNYRPIIILTRLRLYPHSHALDTGFVSDVSRFSPFKRVLFLNSLFSGERTPEVDILPGGKQGLITGKGLKAVMHSYRAER